MMNRLTMAAALLAGVAWGQPVIVQGPIAGPGSDPLSGTCTFAPTADFIASDGKFVTGTLSAPFTAGLLRIALEPNDTGLPANTSYIGSCIARTQVVTGTDGKQHTSQGEWKLVLFVRSPPNSSLLSATMLLNPPTPGVLVPWQAISFAGVANGCFAVAGGLASTFPCGQLVSGLTWTQMDLFSWTQM